MGSLILNVNTRLLSKALRHVSNKSGTLRQCRCFSHKHVFSPKVSTYLFRYNRIIDFSRVTPVRFASTVNVIETKPQVESTINVNQSDRVNHSYSVENNSDENFFIVRDKGKGIEDVAGQTGDSALPPIPEPPAPPVEVVTEAATKTIDPELLAKLIESGVEPSLADLGIGFRWYSPVSYLRSVLEYLHVTWELPWWGCIVLTTFVLRMLTFPIYIRCRRYMIEMSNKSPKLQQLQLEVRAAQMGGDNLRVAILNHEMALAFKDMKVGKAMTPILIQGATFIPFFGALRSMANLPVESMKHGGILWFQDLTLPDQFYILPITTSATLGLMLWLGTETMKIRDATSNVAKIGMVAMPVVILAFSVNFPAAVLCYWTTTNFFSLAQSLVLKIPPVERYFNLPKAIPPPKMQGFDANFVKNMKDSYKNTKMISEINRREALNQQMFAQAGREPIKRTFKKNPLLAQSKPK